jgi:hypothetical protein
MTGVERSETPLVDDLVAGDLLVSSASSDVVATVVDLADEDGWLVLADSRREWRPARSAIERALADGRWTTDDPATEVTFDPDESTFDVPRFDPVLDAAPIVVGNSRSTNRLRVGGCSMVDLSLRTRSAIQRGVMRFDRRDVPESDLEFGVQVGTVTIDAEGVVTIEWFDAPRERE